MVIITCLCYTTAVPVSSGSQHKAREISWTQSVGMCVCSRMSKWVSESEIIFITNWLHFHTAYSGPQGWSWRAKYCQHKHTDIHTDTCAHKCTVTNGESEFRRAATVKWMQGKVAHHCSRWLAHFHFNYTAQWHCCAYSQAHMHLQRGKHTQIHAQALCTRTHCTQWTPISHFSELCTIGCRHKARRTGTDS